MTGKGINLYEVKDNQRKLIAILKKELKEKEIKYWIEPETISSIAMNEKEVFEQYIKTLREFSNFVTRDKEVKEFKYYKWNIEKEKNEELVFWTHKKWKKDNNYNRVMIVVIEIKNMVLRHKIFTRKKENY